ncbi:hypothetical protein BS78_07G154200 [Paspalum vaginatum]|nr:hypothetical protein BS78_07G154200 [Paspalum vaginatum]
MLITTPRISCCNIENIPPKLRIATLKILPLFNLKFPSMCDPQHYSAPTCSARGYSLHGGCTREPSQSPLVKLAALLGDCSATDSHA